MARIALDRKGWNALARSMLRILLTVFLVGAIFYLLVIFSYEFVTELLR